MQKLGYVPVNKFFSYCRRSKCVLECVDLIEIMLRNKNLKQRKLILLVYWARITVDEFPKTCNEV